MRSSLEIRTSTTNDQHHFILALATNLSASYLVFDTIDKGACLAEREPIVETFIMPSVSASSKQMSLSLRLLSLWLLTALLQSAHARAVIDNSTSPSSVDSVDSVGGGQPAEIDAKVCNSGGSDAASCLSDIDESTAATNDSRDKDSQDETATNAASLSVSADASRIDDSSFPESRVLWKGECGLWLAPSTLKGAGLGMYAGKDYKVGQDLQTVGDIVIPIVDLPRHNEHRGRPYSYLWSEYVWGAEGFRAMLWEGYTSVDAASPGFGSAANSFLPLYNVEEHSDLSVDSADLDRKVDPGAGGFTTYHNRRSSALEDIQTGQELFVSYSDVWFSEREWLGPIPLSDDLNKANALALAFHDLEMKSNAPMSVLHEAWESFVSNSVFKKSRVIGAFRHDEYKEEVETLKDKTFKHLRIEQSTRTLEWLQNYGTCADHLEAGRSTIRQAGRGAIASRDMPAGTIVAQIPLIHITDRSIFDMYQPRMEDNGEIHVDPNAPIGKQLMLNYCYGHGDSTLLLCPYGPIVNYINHNQTLANVQLKWADHWRGNHMPHLLQHPLQNLESDATAKLAFDIIATRDIKKGDEVFLDYGDAWEAAWNEHVRTWEPLPQSYTFSGAIPCQSHGCV
jgi:SET domain